MKMRPKVLIDTIGIDPSIHRRLCPAMAVITHHYELFNFMTTVTDQSPTEA
jgi:hypothetical protein